jgi:hypothetical protein
MTTIELPARERCEATTLYLSACFRRCCAFPQLLTELCVTASMARQHTRTRNSVVILWRRCAGRECDSVLRAFLFLCSLSGCSLGGTAEFFRGVLLLSFGNLLLCSLIDANVHIGDRSSSDLRLFSCSLFVFFWPRCSFL